MMKNQVDEFLKNLLEVVKESQILGYMTRDKKLQEETITKLTNLKEEATKLKEKAIGLQDENYANLMLSIECLSDALTNELSMWVYLKNEDPNTAWNLLINAQDWISASIHASEIPGLNQEGYMNKLSVIEQVIFPPQTFMSPGMVVESSKCSLCNNDYSECEHIAGKAYMGKFCQQIPKIKEFTEASLVGYPYDKKARVTSFGEGDGLARDIMTWKVYKDEKFEKLGKGQT